MVSQVTNKLNHMKNKLKIFIIRIFFRCEIYASYNSVYRHQTIWRFAFHPRNISTTIAGLIITPFLFIHSGLNGLIEFWSTAYEVESDLNYEIWGENKPSESECYGMF